MNISLVGYLKRLAYLLEFFWGILWYDADDLVIEIDGEDPDDPVAPCDSELVRLP